MLLEERHPSLTFSCSGFSSSLSLRRSWSAVLSSWLICSVVWVSASSSWLSFSSFCFCSLTLMRRSSSSRKSLRRLNSAVTISSRSPACSWDTGRIFTCFSSNTNQRLSHLKSQQHNKQDDNGEIHRSYSNGLIFTAAWLWWQYAEWTSTSNRLL